MFSPKPESDLPLHNLIAPLDKEIVYCRLLSALLNRGDICHVKDELSAELQCTRSVLDGVHAQLTKDVKAVIANCSDGEHAASKFLSAVEVSKTGNADEQKAREADLVTIAFLEIGMRRGAELVLRQELPSRLFERYEGAKKSDGTASLIDTDFDFTAKRLWRAEWEMFLMEKLRDAPLDLRKRMKVLCFSAANPNLELSIYQRLGFCPDNVFTVERIPQVASQLSINLRKLGGWFQKVQVITGELERYLTTTAQAFDVISLDFHGCFSNSKIDLVSKIRLKDRALVLLNLEKGREPRNAQDSIVNWVLEEQYNKATQNPFAAQLSNIQEAPSPFEVGEMDKTNRHELLREGRDKSEWTLLTYLGIAHSMRSSIFYRKFDELAADQVPDRSPKLVYNIASDMLCIACDGLRAIFSPGKELDDASKFVRHKLFLLSQATMANLHLPWDYRQFSYRSKASHANQEYRSTFAELRTCKTDNPLVDFIARSAIEIFRLQGIHEKPTCFLELPLKYGAESAYSYARRSFELGQMKGWNKLKKQIRSRCIADKGVLESYILGYRDKGVWNRVDSIRIPTLLACASLASLDVPFAGCPLADADYRSQADKRRQLG